jgi:hypothetical protein
MLLCNHLTQRSRYSPSRGEPKDPPALAHEAGRHAQLLTATRLTWGGFISEKAKGDTNALKTPMEFQQIINEHGQWKWFGNQK